MKKFNKEKLTVTTYNDKKKNKVITIGETKSGKLHVLNITDLKVKKKKSNNDNQTATFINGMYVVTGGDKVSAGIKSHEFYLETLCKIAGRYNGTLTEFSEKYLNPFEIKFNDKVLATIHLNPEQKTLKSELFTVGLDVKGHVLLQRLLCTFSERLRNSVLRNFEVKLKTTVRSGAVPNTSRSTKRLHGEFDGDSMSIVDIAEYYSKKYDDDVTVGSIEDSNLKVDQFINDMLMGGNNSFNSHDVSKALDNLDNLTSNLDTSLDELVFPEDSLTSEDLKKMTNVEYGENLKNILKEDDSTKDVVLIKLPAEPDIGAYYDMVKARHAIKEKEKDDAIKAKKVESSSMYGKCGSIDESKVFSIGDIDSTLLNLFSRIANGESSVRRLLHDTLDTVTFYVRNVYAVQFKYHNEKDSLKIEVYSENFANTWTRDKAKEKLETFTTLLGSFLRDRHEFDLETQVVIVSDESDKNDTSNNLKSSNIPQFLTLPGGHDLINSVFAGITLPPNFPVNTVDAEWVKKVKELNGHLNAGLGPLSSGVFGFSPAAKSEEISMKDVTEKILSKLQDEEVIGLKRLDSEGKITKKKKKRSNSDANNSQQVHQLTDIEKLKFVADNAKDENVSKLTNDLIRFIESDKQEGDE